MASFANSNPCSIPIVPAITNQIKDAIEGAIITPIMNSFIVRPLDMRAIKVPTKGVHTINQVK